MHSKKRMDGILLCVFICLCAIGTVLCKTDEFSCHECRSDMQPLCADEFGGKDNKFLKPCNMSDESMTVSCRKEVNKVQPYKGAVIIRSCYYTDGFKPEEEIEVYGATYWNCFDYGCNGQQSVKSTFSLIGFIMTIYNIL